MSRPALAIYWAAGCGGCEIAVLELHERFLTLTDRLELVFCPCLMDAKVSDLEARPDGSIHLCLFNGALRTEENVHMARLLRRKSRHLVAFGACAALGGIPGLANGADRETLMDRAYRGPGVDPISGAGVPGGGLPGPDALLPCGEPAGLPALLPAATPLDRAVPVDYVIPGCPPEAETVWRGCSALLGDDLPPTGAVLGAGTETVCEECPLDKRGTLITRFHRVHEIIPEPGWCLLEQGIVCSGLATRSGCGARCPAAGVPCRGCYGPAGRAEDQGLALLGALGSRVAGDSEAAIRETARSFRDPVGTLYRFGLPGSLLGRSKPAAEPAAPVSTEGCDGEGASLSGGEAP